MKTMKFLSIIAMFACAAATGLAQTVSFTDDFNDGVRNTNKWIHSPYMNNMAIFKETGGRVVLFRNSLDPYDQYVQWDAKFTYRYDNKDTLTIKTTVRMPHKIKTGGNSMQLGPGFIVDGTKFIELTVNDDIYGRNFVLYTYDYATPDTFHEEYFDAPKNITTFDLIIKYSAVNDSILLYWAIPGIAKNFLITPRQPLSNFITGSVPRRLTPYIAGFTYGGPLPEAWGVSVDNFSAIRVNAL